MGGGLSLHQFALLYLREMILWGKNNNAGLLLLLKQIYKNTLSLDWKHPNPFHYEKNIVTLSLKKEKKKDSHATYGFIMWDF